jgi:D-arabinose 1-dehydrogenase-like Zn-dependent alcohol dehydrogenase
MAPELNDTDAAPLLCAGVTTFNSLRNSGARADDTVAILGIGGLGHLAIQYAARSGYRTIAVARGQDKGPLAKELGAHVYIDSTTQDPAKELQKIGGANIILSTVTSAKALEWTIDGLAPSGKLIVVGAPDGPVVVSRFRCCLAAAPLPAGPPAPAWTPRTRSNSTRSPVSNP